MPPRPAPPLINLKNSEQARRASLYFLALILGGLLTIGVYNLGKLIGPKTIDAPALPFGLPPGNQLAIGQDQELIPSEISPEIRQELSRGFELLQAGNWQSAYDIFDRLALHNSNLPAALAGKARAMLASSQAITAERSASIETLLSQLERKLPGTGEALFLRGSLAYKQGQSTVALEFLEQAVKKAPGLPEPHLLLGSVLLAGGQPLGAQTQARTGISLTEGADPRFYVLLARAYHDEGSLDSCSQVVEYGLTRFPTSIELTLLDGRLQEYKGAFDAAEKVYRKILAQLPEHLEASQALRTLGEKSPPGQKAGKGMVTPRERADLAIRILEPLVAAYPQNMPLRDALGQAYLKARLFDLAKVQFEAVLQNDPEYPDIQLRLQESNAVDRNPQMELVMAAELQRGVDSLRIVKTAERSSSERLGHYLVRWGASPREFFHKYPESQFQKKKPLVWQESIFEPPLQIVSTLVFRKDRGLSEVHVLVRDTSYRANKRGIVYDLYGRLLGQNSRISGIGVSTGDSECDSISFQGAVWETADNFELMLQRSTHKAEVRMLRLDKGQFETMPRLCGHMDRIFEY